MRLLSLELENYRQHRATTLQFNEGLTGIVGPNGSGKSTILEAIAWTIYGAAAVRSRGKVEDLLHQHASGRDELRAMLEFELDGHRYRVERTAKIAAVYRDGAAVAQTTRGATEALVAVLGLDYPAFFTSYFTAQNELDFLANLQAARRKEFVGRLLGLDSLAEAQRRARGDGSALSREAAGLAGGIGDLEALERALAESVAELERAAAEASRAAEAAGLAEGAHAAAERPWREALDAEREHHRVARDLERASGELERHRERGQRTAADFEAARRAADQLAHLRVELARRPAVEVDLTRLEELARSAARRADLARTLERARSALTKELEKVTACRSALAASPRPEPDVTALTAQREELLRLFQVASEREARAEAERNRLESSRAELIGRLARLAGGDGACPLCGQPLAGEHGDAREHLQAELEAIHSAIATHTAPRRNDVESSVAVRARGQRLREALERAEAQERAHREAAGAIEVAEQGARRQEAEVKALERDLADLPDHYDPAAHDRARKEAARLGELAGLARSLEERAGEIGRLEAELAALATTEVELRATVAGLTGSLAATGHDEARLAALAAAELAARQERDRTRQERDRADGARRAAEGVSAERRDRLREARDKRERLASLRKEALALETLTRLFGELRDQLSARIGPELAGSAGALLAQLTEGRYRELLLDDDFQVSLESDGGLFPLNRFSGGEQDVVNLALRLAISEQISARTGRRLELLILDEVFGSLDEQRRDQALDVLRSLTNRYRQVIVITHVDTILRDVAQVFKVDYDENARTTRVASS